MLRRTVGLEKREPGPGVSGRLKQNPWQFKFCKIAACDRGQRPATASPDIGDPAPVLQLSTVRPWPLTTGADTGNFGHQFLVLDIIDKLERGEESRSILWWELFHKKEVWK